MARKGRRQLRRLDARLAQTHPDMDHGEALIRSGLVLVNGRPVTNPAALVPADASIALAQNRPLRGEAKLRAALDAFGVPVRGRIALDVGASTGGFTRVLLAAGARHVYAVDAGHGQLLGSLRRDPRVANLEGVNVGALARELVPQTIEVVTIDLSYLAVAEAVPQLEAVDIDDGADLIALVKPMFELHLATLPTDAADLRKAAARATEGLRLAGWAPCAVIESPVRGARGAVEFLLHARREVRRANALAADAQ